MPRSKTTFEITIKTIHGRFLLRPSKQLNEIILGVLGRFLPRYKVELHLIVVASNHIHMIVTVEDIQSLSNFMRDFNGNVAREVGRLHNWREKFWCRRYASISILDDAKMMERAHYILSHGCKEKLVLRSKDWPGVNCVEALTKGKPLFGVWYDRTKEYEASMAGQEFSPGDFSTRYEVPLTPLPCLEHLSSKKQREQIKELVHSIQRETRVRLQKEGSRVLGVRKVLRQHPHKRPKKTKRSPAPSCHSSDRDTWKSFRNAYREFVSVFRAASRRLRRGDLNASFPENSFPPALAFVAPSPAPT
jgi:REP element-mobilizing transposase RayT